MAMPTRQPRSDAQRADRDERRRLDPHGSLLRPHAERLLWDAGIGPGMRVLDVGCGTGEVSVLLADLIGPSGEVVAIDRSVAALAVAERRFGALGLGQIRLVEGEAGSMAFDDPFDAPDEFPAADERFPQASPMLANLGAFLCSLYYGLPGIRPSLRDPATWAERRVVLPAGWRSIEVERLWVRGRPMRLVARHGAAHAQLEPAQPTS